MKNSKIIFMLMPSATKHEVELEHIPEKGDSVFYKKVEWEVIKKSFIYEDNLIRIWMAKK